MSPDVGEPQVQRSSNKHMNISGKAKKHEVITASLSTSLCFVSRCLSVSPRDSTTRVVRALGLR